MKTIQRIAVYPGSFDPIHQGHVDIIERMAPVFDKVIILIAQSSQKQSLFNVDERKLMIEKSFKAFIKC
jgi:pantetheine-phosphate adenylyltransferase